MRELVKRLRSEAVNWSASCGDLFDEAADRIEALEEALRKIEDLVAKIDEAADRIEALEEALRKIEDLVAKIERINALEAALHKIDDTSIDYVAVRIARTALAPEQDK